MSSASSSRIRDCASRFGEGSSTGSVASRSSICLDRLQLLAAILATRQVLLQYSSQLIRQLAVIQQHDAISCALTLHCPTSTSLKIFACTSGLRALTQSLTTNRQSLSFNFSAPTSSPAASAWPGTAYSSPSPPSCSTSRRSSSASTPGSASTQKPSVRAASTCPAPR